jgi:hypothetical protein
VQSSRRYAKSVAGLSHPLKADERLNRLRKNAVLYQGTTSEAAEKIDILVEPLSRNANVEVPSAPHFVIPTGAERSGGTCGAPFSLESSLREQTYTFIFRDSVAREDRGYRGTRNSRELLTGKAHRRSTALRSGRDDKM